MKRTFKISEHYLENIKVSQNFKFLVMSDFHFSIPWKKTKNSCILEMVKSLQPDYIFIPGDILDMASEFSLIKEELFPFFESLGKICPVVCVLGNHDLAAKQKGKKRWTKVDIKDYVTGMKQIPNVHLLQNDIYRDKDKNITVVGYENSFSYYHSIPGEPKEKFQQEISNAKQPLFKEDLNIALLHSPICLEDEDCFRLFSPYDFIFTGHMHNGCVPPLLDELWKGNKGIVAPGKSLFPNLARGSMEGRLFISGGVVKLQPHAPFCLSLFDCFFPMSLDLFFVSKQKQEEEDKSYYKKIKKG